jgi:predicted NAD/FAD-dependent oxidoreductase
MNQIHKSLLNRSSFAPGVCIDRIVDNGDYLSIFQNDRDIGHFKNIVLTCPAPQTATLIETVDPEFAALISQRRMQGQWVAMIKSKSAKHHDILRFNGPLIDFAIKQVANATANDYWVIYLDQQWSESNIDLPNEWIAELLYREMCLTGLFPELIKEDIQMHRWRYAHALDHKPITQLTSTKASIHIAGDWTGQGGLIAALKSVERLLKSH